MIQSTTFTWRKSWKKRSFISKWSS